ncbi:unnamed protein product [Cyprideis torosa]|uniref:Uncharacterized protein n=1 Tax=Cyprideis torosa TaxID=163714 RepID=A0A7R8WPR6_9CRUS|nr:unnamed protein product [Cyprideis torosa]CAG0901057.1 unnamed protein product [Cyprideis torosa]
MVLTVNGHVVDESPRDIRTFIRSHSYLKETASTLLSTSTKVVGPVGLVYVMQREFAATIPHDKNVTLIGTEDVTTCLVVILRHTGSGATALGHFDTAAHHEGIRMMVQRVQELSIGYPEGRIEATLIGAFSDPKGVSDEVIAGVLWPEMALRHARIFTGEHAMLESYDPNLGLLRIGPFNYEPMRGVDLWLEQNDDFIRQHLSSSPEVEPPGFATQTRMALKHIQEHPFPLVTVFPDNKPHFYRKDESGSWVQVRY